MYSKIQLKELAIKFLRETYLRITADSPKYFKIFQYITGVLAVICYLPAALEMLHIQVPMIVEKWTSLVIGNVSTGMFIMSLITAKDQNVAMIDGTDSVVATTDKVLKPFTAAMDKINAVKNDIPVVIMKPVSVIVDIIKS